MGPAAQFPSLSPLSPSPALLLAQVTLQQQTVSVNEMMQLTQVHLDEGSF